MGNACKKNVKEQVVEPKPAAPAPPPPARVEDDEELKRLQALNERLKAEKEALEAELARWREAQKAKMESMIEEMETVQRETDRIIKGPDEGEVADMRGKAEAELRAELNEADREQLKELQKRADHIRTEMARLKSEQERLESIRTNTNEEAANLETLLLRLENRQAASDSSTETTDSVLQARAVARVAHYYRAIEKPASCSDLLSQTRIDCAELSSQTMRNTKALLHAFTTGDESWYKEKPIRGAVCNALQCGEEPHDRWSCNLCALLDVTDAPLLL